ncbi:DUF2079 domain-containing protein [Synechocystis salina LEGE 06155]|nr:DUF2079 domain-containing protein [Synechocystis salina LEGE 06155]
MEVSQSKPEGFLPPRSLLIGMAIGAVILFICATVRHWLFQSTALDLGFFDQAIYLISRGEYPRVSFRGFHILGDHAAFLVYPIAIFYKIYPSVYWLFFIQAIALALGAWPTWQLAKQTGLGEQESLTMALVYGLYPLIFNINLFDFHTEVIAVPALLWAVWSARGNKWSIFFISLIIILASKAVLSLTVFMLGIWLLIWERKKLMGIITTVAGIAWFIIATKGIIPAFSGEEAAAVGRYSFLGDSVTEIILNLILKPQIVLGMLFTLDNLFYLVLLTAPVIWGIWGKAWAMFIPAIPALFVNLVTDYLPQKDLIHQYSLPILPFLLLVVMTHWHRGTSWLKKPRWIILWTAIAFLALGKYTYFFGRYWHHWGQLANLQTAVSLVQPGDRVLTSPHLAAHLSHRPDLELAIEAEAPFDLNRFDAVLLQTNYAGWENSQGTVEALAQQVSQDSAFTPEYQENEVILYRRAPSIP